VLMLMIATFSTQNISIVCLLNEINTIASMIGDNISKIEDKWNTMEIWVSRVTFLLYASKAYSERYLDMKNISPHPHTF